MNSDNVTVTEGRLKNTLKTTIEPIIMPKINNQINKAFKESIIQVGYVVKFYKYLDKAEVKLLKQNKKVLCKLPHHTMGDLIDFFVPTGTEAFCTNLNEPCIIPRAEIPCLVLDIDDESDEQFLLSYYTPEDLTGINLPDQGHVRISCFTATNETYLDFGIGGLSVTSTSKPTASYGEDEDEMTSLDFENLPLLECEVIKKYDDYYCDIKLSDGEVLERVRCNSKPVLNSTGVLVFLDDDSNNPFVITTPSSSGGFDVDDYEVDFTYSWGQPLLNEDCITINPILKRKE